MITIYNAANSIEAYLIKNLLEQQEIPAYVLGEHLQSGVGEIPAIGLVRVSVSDSDYARAKEIVDEWDASVVIEESATDYSYITT
ncbi:MAG TPA: DUF2007 domain-containing protein [Methylotenera sp.]|nr:DUF2007 domain-containing protein [Methylotenera sp.]